MNKKEMKGKKRKSQLRNAPSLLVFILVIANFVLSLCAHSGGRIRSTFDHLAMLTNTMTLQIKLTLANLIKPIWLAIGRRTREWILLQKTHYHLRTFSDHLRSFWCWQKAEKASTLAAYPLKEFNFYGYCDMSVMLTEEVFILKWRSIWSNHSHKTVDVTSFVIIFKHYSSSFTNGNRFHCARMLFIWQRDMTRVFVLPARANLSPSTVKHWVKASCLIKHFNETWPCAEYNNYRVLRSSPSLPQIRRTSSGAPINMINDRSHSANLVK